MWRFTGDADGDGAVSHKYLLDISEKLSQRYGRLIDQGQVFRVKSVDIRMFNPDTTIEDETLSVAGDLVYYEPTKMRKLAWLNARDAWRNNRRALGVKSRDADFRVGLHEGYSTDVGVWNDGVKFNAWINADAHPLMLTHGATPQSIFETWNVNMTDSTADIDPKDPNGGFGHWAQKDVDSLADTLDFVANQTKFYTRYQASPTMTHVPFQLNFSAWFDNGTSDPPDFGSASNAEHIVSGLNVMCGVVGLYIDTTTVDDSETENQDYGVEVSLEIERWSPIRAKMPKALQGQL